ncbi:unnamed protein product [Cochlearia groenlandica]
MPICCSRSSTQVVVGEQRSQSQSGNGKNSEGGIKFGFYLIKGKNKNSMEDYHVSKFIINNNNGDNELGLFAIFDGHKGHNVASYLQKHLFSNILNNGEFLIDPRRAIKKAYENTDHIILSDTGFDGGSTAVTAVLINKKTLWVANVGDSRAIVCRRGKAKQVSVDHDPGNDQERDMIESKGGFVTNRPGDVARVNGLLAVSRVFGDKNLKAYLNIEPDIKDVDIDSHIDLLVLASDGVSKVMTNQEAVDIAKKMRDPKEGAKQVVAEALKRNSKDDISCIVVRFR